MGYRMDMTDANFFLPKESHSAALKAIQALVSKGQCYTWIRFKGDSSWERLEDAFSSWRWSVSFDDDENINNIQFDGTHSGDEEILLETLAPFVRSGSYIEMIGEDGGIWRWVFKDGEFGTVYPAVTWE